MAGSGTIWLPVAPSFRGFGAQVVKEAAGAARQAGDKLDSELGAAGKRAGQAAGKGMADGVRASAAEVEKATRAVVTARKSEADATANVTLAEARLADARTKGASAKTIEKNEQALESARRRAETAARQLSGAEGDLDAVRRGEAGRASAVVRASSQVESARLKSADAADRVALAEKDLERVQNNSKATATQVATAQAKLSRARSEQTSAVDTLRAKEQLYEATLEDVERQSKRAADAQDEVARSSNDAAGGMGQAATIARNLAFAFGAAAGAAVAMGLDVSNQVARMNNQLGLTGEAARQLEGEVGAVMRGGIAGSAEDAATAVGTLNSQFKYLGFEGEKTATELSRNFLAFTDTFGVSMAETTQTVGQLVKNGLAKDATEGIDLLTASFQRVPAQMRDELPEIINEYGTFFRGLGFSGEEAFGVLVNAAENGKWALDKTGDALKEFTIRGTDMSKTSVGAYEAMGLSAQDMATKLAEGGPAAQDALQQTANALLGMEDPVARANAAIALFGAPLEDLSVDQIPQFLSGLSGAEASMQGFSGTSEQMAQSIENSVGGRFNALKGTVMDLAGQGFMALWDAVARGIQLFNEFRTPILLVTTAVGALAIGMGAYAAVQAIVSAGGAVGAFASLAGAIRGTAIAQFLLNGAMWASPITWIVAGIAALVAGLIWFFTQTETGKVVWDSLVLAFTTGWEWVKGAFSAAWGFIQPILSGIWTAVQFLGAVFAAVVLGGIIVGWNAMSAVLQAAYHGIIKPTIDLFAAAGRWLWDNVLSPVFGWIGDRFTQVGDTIRRVYDSIIKPTFDFLGSVISTVVDNVITPAFDRIKDGLSSVGDFFRVIADGIRSVWDGVKGHVARPINFVIDTVWNNGLLKAWNTIAGFLPGLPTAAPLSPVAFAEGGPVPMTPGAKRGKDSVHALMMPNEHVLDVNNVRNAGGHGQVYQMRSMIDRGVPFTWVNGRVVPAGHGLEPTQRFAEGGEVKGSRLSPSPGEGGLEPIAVLAKRLIHRIWPDITEIGGYRQDAYPEHPSGRALDVMVGVGNPAGDEVTSWALANDKILPLIHALWKQTVWMPDGSTQPMGDRGSPTQNHMDHPHLWYQPKNVDPNVVPEGLVGHDGLNRDDRMGIIKTKIGEILDKALDPIREGISRVVGDPPPEVLGIPPIALDETKNAALDGAFSFAENIAGDLKEVYNKAKDVVTSVTGLFRDEGGYIPNGKSIVNNETGKPEAVFNWKQVEQLGEILNSVRDLDHLWAILGEMGHTMATGDYRGRMHGLTGLDEDSELVHALVSVNEGLDQFGEHMAGVLEAAGTKALKGYGDSALDFFGFGALASSGAEIYDAFNKPPESQGGATTGATSAIATAGPTSAGGGIVTHGDPNAVYETREVALETAMPDLDRANPPGAGAERWRSMMIDALKNQGLDEWANNPAIVDRFIKQIDTESGGDPNIAQQIVDVNGTGESAGVGLGQAIPGTWAAYRDPSLPDDRRNGWAMLNFMARYVSQKYGPQGYERIGNGVGYDRGGIANDLGFMAKYTLRPERVLSPSQTEAFEGWMDAGTPDGKLEVLNGLPSSADFEAMASRFSQENDENSPGWGRSGPLVNIERLEARDEEEAMRKVHRETRRASRSAGFSGGYA